MTSSRRRGSSRSFERFVGRRYLRGTGRRVSLFGALRNVSGLIMSLFRRGDDHVFRGVDQEDARLVTFITNLAIGGVAVGVMALIVVIGVLNGLQESLRDRILSGGPHGHVVDLANGMRMEDWRPVLQQVSEEDGVVSAAPFVYTKIVINAGDAFNEALVLRGLAEDPDASRAVSLREHLVEGSATPFSTTRSGAPGLIVGQGVADRLGLYPEKRVTVASIQNAPLSSTGAFVPSMARFEVVGTFRTGLYQYDDELVIGPLEAVQELVGLDGAVTGIEFDVHDPWVAGEVSANLENNLKEVPGGPYRVEGWEELNANLFSALRLEKLGMAVVLVLIVLVAAFNIVSTLVMMVADRTREIGILRAMGATSGSIGRIFRNIGLFIGGTGTAIGGILGALLAFALGHYEFISLPSDVYFIDRLPISLAPLDVTLIVVGSLLISWLATIYPAKRAAALMPVDAIARE